MSQGQNVTVDILIGSKCHCGCFVSSRHRLQQISINVSANDNNPKKIEEVTERGFSRISEVIVTTKIIVSSLRKIIDKLLTAV